MTSDTRKAQIEMYLRDQETKDLLTMVMDDIITDVQCVAALLVVHGYRQANEDFISLVDGVNRGALPVSALIAAIEDSHS
jgi:hypothetical protein